MFHYSLPAVTKGRTYAHYGDVGTCETVYKPGDRQHHTFLIHAPMIHDLENIGETGVTFTIVEFLESATAPLPMLT